MSVTGKPCFLPNLTCRMCLEEGRKCLEAGAEPSPKKTNASVCSPPTSPSVTTPGRCLEGGEVGARGGRAQGPGGVLTHADVSQLGRAQLQVLENRGQDGREQLVGGGVLQREARPRWPRPSVREVPGPPLPAPLSQLCSRAASGAKGTARRSQTPARRLSPRDRPGASP